MYMWGRNGHTAVQTTFLTYTLLLVPTLGDQQVSTDTRIPTENNCTKPKSFQ